MASFSVCTYNVHMFYDEAGRHTYEEMVKLLTELKPDVLCLQEATSHHINKLQADLDYQYQHYKSRGVAIFSKYQIADVLYQHKGNKTRAITAKVSLDPDLEPLYITALHLSHRVEPARMKEISDLEKCLENVFKEEGCQIWTGDFNCLTREDYDDKTWADIARVRWDLHNVISGVLHSLWWRSNNVLLILMVSLTVLLCEHSNAVQNPILSGED